jgi:GntR family transcriptional regulator/MocR family aminotransferase
VITSGAQQAISLCAQLLLQPGDGVAVENPGYRAAGHAFALAGARVSGVPVDEEGMDCARWQLPDCRLAYVTPAHQYPTGVTMSLARRLALLAWAERRDGWIIEDDYDGEYRYSGAPWHRWLRWIGRAGAVRRHLRQDRLPGAAPGLPGAAQAAGAGVQPGQGAGGAAFGSGQPVRWRVHGPGHFQRHIRRMRRAALARRNVLKAGWPVDVPGLGAMPEVAAGLHVKVAVDNFAREQELVARAEAVGWRSIR